MNISDFTQPEIRHLLLECNFTDEQEKLFLLRCKNIPLEACAEKMDMSMATISRINKKVKDKILRCL